MTPLGSLSGFGSDAEMLEYVALSKLLKGKKTPH
jgi:hypothetical protein